MERLLSLWLAGAVFAVGLLLSVPASALGLDRALPEPNLGAARAKGVVVWSHGRSLSEEDYKSPSPIYLQALRADGWDVLRFDRLAANDTLFRSSRRLADYAAALKREGYKQVVLAGQSFGGFLSLMAADASRAVDAVIATAPAAYGNFQDFYGSWRLNATKLYPLLRRVKTARVMVFYFHDDDFDPGGRGEHSREILAKSGRGYAVIDQPAYLTTHWAASTGLFLRRFGPCIRRFIDDSVLHGQMVCHPRWGQMPSAQMKLPLELSGSSQAAAAAPAARTGSGAGVERTGAASGLRDLWYGFYPNGREVLLGVEAVHGNRLSAVYAIGPSIDNKHPATWSRRSGRIVGDGFVFRAPGESTLRFRPTEDGGLAATWIAPDGDSSMEAHLRPIDPDELSGRARGEPLRASAPIAAAAAHGDGHQTEQ